MADELYSALTQRGVSVFYSKQSLERLGISQYKEMIDVALDDAKVLIAVGTSAENLNSSWVRYEWDGFYSDILSGQKQGQVFSYIDKMDPSALPRTLRQLQRFERRSANIEQICNYILGALGRSEAKSTPKYYENQNPQSIRNESAKPFSTYSYLDDKEKERLSSQARLISDNDIEVLCKEISKDPLI